MTDLIWHTETRFINELDPYPHNPRKMSISQAQQLMKSLDKFNYVELIAIQPNNTIIAGHMRVVALKKLKRDKEKIEVRVPNRMLTNEEMKEYLLRSNKNTGSWDWDVLADSWELELLHDIGFSEEELVDNILDIEEDEKEGSEKPRCTSCGQIIRNKDG